MAGLSLSPPSLLRADKEFCGPIPRWGAGMALLKIGDSPSCDARFKKAFLSWGYGGLEGVSPWVTA